MARLRHPLIVLAAVLTLMLTGSASGQVVSSQGLTATVNPTLAWIGSQARGADVATSRATITADEKSFEVVITYSR